MNTLTIYGAIKKEKTSPLMLAKEKNKQCNNHLIRDKLIITVACLLFISTFIVWFVRLFAN